MSAPVRALAKGLSVQTATTIQTMSHTATGWQLTSTEHGLLPHVYSKVVFAIPPRQVGPILGANSPTISAAADSINMQPCWTVMMQFDAQPNLSFDAAFIRSGPLSFIARNGSKPDRTGQETWVLHATSAWTQAHLELKPDEIISLLVAEFQSLGGPQPVSSTAHRWRYGRSDPTISIGCVWDQDTQIGLCGDWLNGGDVEGAWLSGRALANQIQ
jgi:predicted NAD/FAD-dependent oxidoreductase